MDAIDTLTIGQAREAIQRGKEIEKIIDGDGSGYGSGYGDGDGDGYGNS